MDELIKLLDKNLEYDGHELQDECVVIHVSSTRVDAICPYCGMASRQVHSCMTRTLKDLPIQGKKVKILLRQKKYFCKNGTCNRRTFAERFEFFEPRAAVTKRLESEIMRVSLTQSSVAASRYLRSSVADVSKSTICNLLKKGREEQCG